MAETRYCENSVCVKALPADVGPRRRYCSPACRQQAHRGRHRPVPVPTGPQLAARRLGSAEDLRAKAAGAQAIAAGLRRNLLERYIWPHAHHRGAGPGGYTTAAAELAAAAHEVLVAAVAADRAVGLSWAQIGDQLGIDATTARRRYAQPGHAAPAAVDVMHARLADLPADTRPTPSVAPYDELLRQPGRAPAPQAGHDWDDTDLCLWRDEGRWGLTGPDGEIEVPEFGLFGGSLAAGDTKGAQAAAAAAITTLTGRAVTGWDPDEVSRSVYGPSSWYACLASDGVVV